MNALDVFTAARPDIEVDDGILDAIAADVFDGRPLRRSSSGRWRLLAVAAAVVALIAGLAAVVGRPGGSVPADTVPPAIPDDGEPLAMLPADPSPWQIMGSVTEPVVDPVLSWSAVIARPDGSGGYEFPVIVRRGPSDVTLVRAGAEGWLTVESVGLRDERRGELVTDSTAGRLIVQFELGDGSSVSVTTPYREPLSGERARVMQIAAGIEFREDDGADFKALPDGFEVVAPWQPGRVHTARWTSFQMADGDEWYTVNVVANPDPVFALRGMDDAVTPVGVRGTTGFLSTRRFPGRDDVQELALVWQEQPGQWVRVHDAGPTHSQPDLLAFAESLREVSAAEWDAVVTPLDETGTPATTAPPPTSPLAAPGTTAPPATTVPPATTAPQTAPPGSVLVGNAAQVGGLAAQRARSLELQGAEVLEPANATVPGDVALATTRVFARSGAGELADWVAGELGVDLVEPIEAMDGIVIEGGVESADVVVVLGLDALTPGLVQDASLVVGDNVTLGAAGVLSERGYIVNAEVSRQLVDMVPVIADLVEAVDPNILVIQLGTNGPFGATDLDVLLDVVSDVPNVIVVNVHADRSWAATNNVLIAEHDQPGDNVIVLDWDAFADQCQGECFVSDGIHLSAAGAEFFADRLGDITGY